MKKYVVALIFFLLPCSLVAQFTNVTATITEPSGQTWNNGNYTATLVNPQPQTPPTINSTRLTAAQMSVSGNINNSGVITTSIADNSVIVPAGTYWQFTLCPNASFRCQVQNASVSGGSQNLSSTLSSGLVNIFFPAAPTSYGYADSEVSPTPNPGGVYYNVTTLIRRVWTGSIWVNDSGSSFITALTTNGSSGASTVNLGTLNIPVPGSSTSNPLTCTEQTDTVKCLQLPPYNANLDPVSATVSFIGGTTTGSISSCTGFNAGDIVSIPGGGVAGVNYIGTITSCSGQVHISPSITNAVGPVLIKHDDTAAYISAINDLWNAQGGYIYVPCGTTYTNAPYQNISGYKAIIPMPSVALGSAPSKPITIIGCEPLVGYGYTGGTNLITDQDTDNLLGGYSPTGPFGGYVAANLFMRNMYVSSTSNNPGITLLDATHIATLQMYQDVFTGTGCTSTPTNVNGSGVKMPTLSNDVRISADFVTVACIYSGITVSEHTHIGSAFAEFVHNTFIFDTGTLGPSTFGGNSVSVDYLWCQLCDNIIVGGITLTPINIQNVDSEVTTQNLIYDPNNTLSGIVNYSVPYDDGRSPSTVCSPIITGGAHLSLYNLNCPAVGFQSGHSIMSGELDYFSGYGAKDIRIWHPDTGTLQFESAKNGGVGQYVQNLTDGTAAYAFWSVGYNSDLTRNFRMAYLTPGSSFGGFLTPNSALLDTGSNVDAMIVNTGKFGASINLCTGNVCDFHVDGTTHLPTVGSNNLCQSDGTNCITKPTSFTVSGLPSAVTSGAGTILRVSDATTFTPGACVGGGSDTMLAVSDGSAWSCH